MADNGLRKNINLYLLFTILFPLFGCADRSLGEPPKERQPDAIKADISGPWKELPRRRLKAHDDSVARLVFNSDGTQLATNGVDKKVRIWQMPDEELLRTMTMSSPWAAFSPDLKRVAVTRFPIQEFELPSGRFRNYFGKNHSLAYSPDGKYLADVENFITGGGAGKIHLWQTSNGKLLQTLGGHKNLVLSVAFSPDGKLLASGGGTTVRLWSVSDGKLLHTQHGTGGCLTFSSDGKLLATGDTQSGGISIWKTPQLVLVDKWNSNPISELAFSPDAKLLAVCSSSDNVPFASLHLLGVSDGKQIQTLVDEKAAAKCVAFSPDGKLLAVGMTDGMIRFFTPTEAQ